MLLRSNLKIGFDNQNIMKRIIYIATLPARHGSDSQCSQQVAFFVQSRCTLQPFSPENQRKWNNNIPMCYFLAHKSHNFRKQLWEKYMDKRKLSKTLRGASSKLHQTSCFCTLNQVPFLVGGLDGIMLFTTAH